VYERNRCLTPLESPAGSNPVGMGWIAARTRLLSGGELRGGIEVVGSGGHGGCPRRSRGDAAGVWLGTSPEDRFIVNVGTATSLRCVLPARWGVADRRVVR